MDDETLLNISLAITFLGIIILLILSFYDKIPTSNFNDIRCEDVGKYVKIEGRVYTITHRNNSMSIRLVQECSQDVFIFDDNDDIQINDTLTVQGTVQEYNGRLSIMADKITVKDDFK